MDIRTAVEAQRISKLPVDKLETTLADLRETADLCTFALLLIRARPFWYQ
jgi:hypothetical protein